MTWESIAYRMPVDAPTTGEVLMVTTGTPNQLSWAVPTPAAHDILSAQHGDTLAAGVSRGSLIVGNATPKWTELTVGGANTFLSANGTDVAWAQPDHGNLAGLGDDDHTQYFLLAGETTTAKLYGGADFEVYDGAPGNLKFSVDGATGTALTQGQYQLFDANTYIARQSDNLRIVTDRAWIGLYPGNTQTIVVTTTQMYPAANDTISCGLAANRWSNVYGVLGNFSGAVDIAGGLTVGSDAGGGNFIQRCVGGWGDVLKVYRGGALQWALQDSGGKAKFTGSAIVAGNLDVGAGCDVTGNITVTGTVDGVDISAFKAAYDAHKHRTLDDTYDTQDYTPSLNAVCVGSSTPVGGGTPVYAWCYLEGQGSGDAAWRLIYARGGTHAHGIPALDTAGPI